MYIYKKNQKKPVLCFLREVYSYFFGTELIPLFPYLRAGLLTKAGLGWGGGGREEDFVVSL